MDNDKNEQPALIARWLFVFNFLTILIDTPPHIGYPSPVRAGSARQNLSNPARVERQQR